MDILPPELIAIILTHLHDSEPEIALSPYALLSKTWRYEVEKITFRSIRITNKELDTFASCFSQCFRQSCLCELEYMIERFDPTIDKVWNACSKSERDEEISINDKVFTEGIKSLFDILGSWSVHHQFELGIGIRDNGEDDPIRIRTSPEFTSVDDLPTLVCISKLDCYSDLLSDTFIDIVRCLPRITRLDLGTDEWDLNLNSPHRRKKRYNGSKQLRLLSKLCPSLREVKLDCANETPFDEREEAPNILLPNSPIDHFSEAMRVLAQMDSMKTFVLTDAVITSQLFSPFNGQELSELAGGGSKDLWPNLTDFHLTYNAMAADGGWYFDRDPHASLSEEDQQVDDDPDSPDNRLLALKHRIHDEQEALAKTINFEKALPGLSFDWEEQHPFRDCQYGHDFRIWPTKKLEDLLSEMALAMARMPALRVFSAGANMPHCRSGQRFECTFFAPGETNENAVDDFEDDDVNRQRRRLYWRVPGQWRMTLELERCFKQALGEDIVIGYYDWYEPQWG